MLKSDWRYRRIVGLALVIVFVAGILTNTAQTVTEPCERPYAHLATRDALRPGELEGAMEALSNDPLIRELETQHILAIRNSGRRSSETWSTFYPMWVFRDAEALERLLNHFDPVDTHATVYERGPSHWIAQWESAYDRNIGRISPRWRDGNVQKGKRRFMQRLIMELCYRHQMLHGQGGQPALLSPSQLSEFFANLNVLDHLGEWFPGGVEGFQKEYDRFHRQKSRSRVPRVAVPTVEATVRAELTAQGVDLSRVKSWKPQVVADRRARQAAQDVELAVEAIRMTEDNRFPLLGLFLVTSGEDETQGVRFSWENAASMIPRHGGTVEGLIRDINRGLQAAGLEPIRPGLHAANLAQEALIQAGVAYVVAHGGLERFRGFEHDPQGRDTFRVDTSGDLLERSGLTLAQLTLRVHERLVPR